MNLAKKIANRGFEGESRHTTRTYGSHGLSKTARRLKSLRNRCAKRAEAKIDFETQLT